MSGVYIKNWSLADWKELLQWAKIGANNAMIGEFAEVEEIPPHGDLIDRDALKAAIYSRLCIKSEKYLSPEEATIVNEIFAAPTVIPAEANEERREYEAQVEAAQYCEMYEPSYDPETGAL